MIRPAELIERKRNGQELGAEEIFELVRRPLNGTPSQVDKTDLNEGFSAMFTHRDWQMPLGVKASSTASCPPHREDRRLSWPRRRKDLD